MQTEEERPRERFISLGPQALTDAELIAVLVRVGFRRTNVAELVRQLLKRFGTLRSMGEEHFSDTLLKQKEPTAGRLTSCTWSCG